MPTQGLPPLPMTGSVAVTKINLQSVSQVQWPKIHLQKIHFHKIHLEKIQFQKINLRIHFGNHNLKAVIVFINLKVSTMHQLTDRDMC